jgi:hypothetical protein
LEFERDDTPTSPRPLFISKENDYSVIAKAVTTDKLGNIFITGTTNGHYHYNPPSGSRPGAGSGTVVTEPLGGRNITLAIHDSDGELKIARTIGTSEDEVGLDLAVLGAYGKDDYLEIWVAGWTSGDLGSTYNPPVFYPMDKNSSGRNAVLLKFFQLPVATQWEHKGLNLEIVLQYGGAARSAKSAATGIAVAPRAPGAYVYERVYVVGNMESGDERSGFSFVLQDNDYFFDATFTSLEGPKSFKFESHNTKAFDIVLGEGTDPTDASKFNAYIVGGADGIDDGTFNLNIPFIYKIDSENNFVMGKGL